MPAEEALLTAADVMRYVAGKTPQSTEHLVREFDEALKAAMYATRCVEEAGKKFTEAQASITMLKKSGVLSPRYLKVIVQRVHKTRDFEKLFLRITDKAQQLG